MSFVFLHLFRLPVVLVLRFQSWRHWPVHFDFEWSFALASPGWRLVPLRLGESASRSGLLRQTPVLLLLPSLWWLGLRGLALGIKTIVATTAWLQSMITTLARGPVPTRHATVALAHDRVPPNLAQLWVLRTVPSGPVRSTAASISSTSAATCLATVVAGANALEKAFMFLLASSFPARLLRCCVQLFERIATVV